jgi:hypothetical protein
VPPPSTRVRARRPCDSCGALEAQRSTQTPAPESRHAQCHGHTCEALTWGSCSEPLQPRGESLPSPEGSLWPATCSAHLDEIHKSVHMLEGAAEAAVRAACIPTSPPPANCCMPSELVLHCIARNQSLRHAVSQRTQSAPGQCTTPGTGPERHAGASRSTVTPTSTSTPRTGARRPPRDTPTPSHGGHAWLARYAELMHVACGRASREAASTMTPSHSRAPLECLVGQQYSWGASAACCTAPVTACQIDFQIWFLVPVTHA